MSFGAFLQACFNDTALQVLGHPLHAGFVRYFGLGRTVMCLHQVWAARRGLRGRGGRLLPEGLGADYPARHGLKDLLF
jgi:hypothetical protein